MPIPPRARRLPRLAPRTLATALLALVAIPLADVAAQEKAAPPAATRPAATRPPLGPGADTNDVYAYLNTAQALLHKQPNKAAPYFRWAAELDPTSPDPLYGERIALLLADRDRLIGYFRGDAKTRRHPDVARADSLQSLAIMRAPLFFRRYDRMLVTSYFEAGIRRAAVSGGMSGEDESEWQYEMSKWINSNEAPAYWRAWLAYSDGDFPRSARLYHEAIKRAKKGDRADLLAERARVFAHLGQNDSAVADFRASMDAEKAIEKDRLVFALKTRAQVEHVLGSLLQAQGDTAAAREAFGRALTEDLAYFPAHVALGTLAYAKGDTATAMHELREAVQLAGGEPWVRYTHGLVLATSGHVAEGVDELLQSIKLAPHWAEPHFLLARLHEAADMNEEAVTHWRNFLARAPAGHQARRYAEEKIAKATASR